MWTYNELYHHGIKGQKWGVRRFQNRDGSLTSDGERRAKRRETINKAFTKSIKRGKDKDNISPAEKMTSDVYKATEHSQKVAKSVSDINDRKRDKKLRKKASTMTEEELKTAISRMQLERQYKALSSERVSNGMDHVKSTLDIVGGTVGTVASVVGLITTFKSLTGGP